LAFPLFFYNRGDAIFLYSNNNNTTNQDDANSLAGLVVCHYRDCSEAQRGVYYIKFGIVPSDDTSQEDLKNLLNTTLLLAKVIIL
jgi:hypothetical protein